MNRTIFTKAASVVVLAIGAAMAPVSTVSAQQTQLNFNGSANLTDQPGSGGANLLIDFLTGQPPAVAGTATGTVTVVPTTNLAGIANGQPGVIQDLVVSSSGVVGAGGAGGATVGSLPISNFLTLGGYTFSLTSTPSGNAFGPISLFDIGTGTTATFGVSGTVTGGAFTTPANYVGVFTAQFSGQSPADVFNTINNGGALPVSFSATFTITPSSTVPEPSTYALLGTGIAALGVTFRRRRNSTNA